MRELPSKESALFKQILASTIYKKGLKATDQILKKYPEHGETLAMKGLFLNHMDKKEEAREFVRKGLRSDLKSHICWHVYGLLHRSDKNYGEALKCYTQALKIDKDNMQILQDYSLLQIQMRNYEAFNESRHHLLQLRPNNQRYWIGLAISYHLLGNYETAEKVLEKYEETLKPSQANYYEHSEMLLYHNLIIEESDNTEAALKHLESIKDNICDRRTWKEKRAQFLLKLNRLQEAKAAYEELINDNPDCYGYYEGLQIAKGINTNDLTPECEEKIIALYKDLTQKYPKSNAIKLFPLLYTTGDNFKMFADEYVRAALRKGVPSLFVNLKKLYSDPQKEAIIEQLVEGYLECLKKHGTFSQGKNEDDVKEPPTAYLWTLYLLSQHYDNKRDTTKALMLINEAIEHTPTLVELYMTKGRIIKHGGNLNEAMKVMNEARELDLQDRFINSKCSKYMLRNDQTEEAEQKIGLFTRGDAPDPLTDLADMQCMWFVLEEGESYIRQKQWGKALKRFHQIEKDQLRSHPYYFRAAQSAIKIYIELYDNPNTITISEENEDYANMTEGEKKKLKSKAKKAAHKKQKEDEERKEKVKEEIKRKVDKPQDDDPDGEKLLKYLLALRALLRAHNIDKENATLHNDIIRFHLAVSNDHEINPTINQVIASEKVILMPENKPLIEFNERFLERNNGVSHLLVGAETLYLIDPEKKHEAENLLLMVDSEEYASTRTLE
ncbi:1112_t:CDS:10, partial [Scutellospora calospora]